MSVPTPDAPRPASTWRERTSGLSTVLTPDGATLINSNGARIPASRTISRVEINEEDQTIRIFFLQESYLFFFKAISLPSDVMDILNSIYQLNMHSNDIKFSVSYGACLLLIMQMQINYWILGEN